MQCSDQIKPRIFHYFWSSKHFTWKTLIRLIHVRPIFLFWRCINNVFLCSAHKNLEEHNWNSHPLVEPLIIVSFITKKCRKKCPYSEFFWSAFSRMRIEYRDLLCKSPYSGRMWEYAKQKNSEYRLEINYDKNNDHDNIYVIIIKTTIFICF